VIDWVPTLPMPSDRSRCHTADVLLEELATASDAVGATAKRNEKVAFIADVLQRLALAEIVPTVAFLVGTTPLGRIGVGWATMSAVSASPAEEASVTIADVDAAFGRLEAMSGEGVQVQRQGELTRLLGRSTESEQRLLRGILSGELRQGALEGVMATAIAKAAGVPVASVRRAAMMAGDLGAAAVAGLTGGKEALEAVSLEPLRPVQPMLASPSAGVGEAMASIGRAQVDWKLDGVRVQAHRVGDNVRLFTRNLNDVTDRLGDVADVVRSFPGGDLVLDGEAMGILDDGSPRRFQESMRRDTGMNAFFFDILHADGTAVHDEPLALRRELLARLVPESARLPSIITSDTATAESFLRSAIDAGHEGVMIKDLTQPYEAGRRGKGWRKVKPVYTLDLVVIAVEWGYGRRTGYLSNIHLGARNPDDGSLVMVGKTFKGMTDEMLRWQTERFTELQVGEGSIGGRHAVHLRPEQVVEIAVDGVQVSTTYPGGVALRFARVKRYRPDKAAVDADTIDAVRSLL
jgi:DNA ligase-1